MRERSDGAVRVWRPADQSHLHRHFRRSLGLTPARYAAAVTRAQLPSA